MKSMKYYVKKQGSRDFLAVDGKWYALYVTGVLVFASEAEATAAFPVGVDCEVMATPDNNTATPAVSSDVAAEGWCIENLRDGAIFDENEGWDCDSFSHKTQTIGSNGKVAIQTVAPKRFATQQEALAKVVALGLPLDGVKVEYSKPKAKKD